TFAPESDHVYRVEDRSHPTPRSPRGIVDARRAQGHKRIVAIAAAGGGIQAAAWTTRGLHGLEVECGKASTPSDFRDSIVLISGVSGGSLGTVAYARSFGPDGGVPARNVVGNAEASAIDEVAWGWTNPDVFRAILPWFRHQFVDRGWALEQKWN